MSQVRTTMAVCGFLVGLVACSKGGGAGAVPSSTSTDVQVIDVTVREVVFDRPVDGRTSGFEFEVVRKGGGFPVRGNLDPVLLVGDHPITSFRYTKDGIAFRTGRTEMIREGASISVRWGMDASGETIDTGKSFHADQVRR